MPTPKLKSYTRRRLWASAKLGLAAIPFSIMLHLLHGTGIRPGTFIIGFGLGFMVGVAELFFFKHWLRNLSFLVHLVVKSILLVAVMFGTFAVLNLLDVIIDGISWQQYMDILFHRSMLFGLLEGLLVITFLLFFLQLDRLLGPGVLLGFITGRYHRPRREKRIFMFLDLKGSTSLAEKMNPDLYFNFLHRYFTEMSEPILETNAEIYQYVGDEIILTWKMKAGLEEANCIRVFYLIEDQIERHREFFLKTFGVVPEFKAGLHSGEVIIAQIGELKSEITYSGDVLNTTARIQSLCNELSQRLILSTVIMEQLSLGPKYEVTELGVVPLRGKAKELKLSVLNRTNR